MKKSSFFFLLTFATLLSLGAADKPDWKNQPFFRPLSGQAIPEGSLASLPLGDGYWAKEGGGFSGLRIIDGAGSDVPYFVRVERRGEQSRHFTPKLLENKVQIGVKTTAVLDLGKSTSSNRINLDSPNEGFNRKVTVEGSLDQKRWKTILVDGFIFDVSNTRNPARKDYLAYPKCDFRYLRVTIFEGDEKKPFILNKASVQVYYPETGRLEERSFTGTPTKSEKDQTLWILDRERKSLPLHEVEFNFESRNFYRPVEVEVSDDQKSWHTLSTCGFLYDAGNSGEENQWKVSGGEDVGRFVRITVTHGNDRPLSVRQITLRHWARTLLFRPTGVAPYRIYYGGSRTQDPRYDLASWAARTSHQETSWTTGEESLNPVYTPPVIPLTEQPGFIWGMLALVMGVLGWFLWGSLRKLINAKPGR